MAKVKKSTIAYLVVLLIAFVIMSILAAGCYPLTEEQTEEDQCILEELPDANDCAPLEQPPVTCVADGQVCPDARKFDDQTWVCCEELI